MDGKPHPFSTSKGRAFRNRILIRDLFTCQMCNVIVRDGRKSARAAVVDHLRPVELRPDLAMDPDNCRTVCKRCHDTTCAHIEAKHAGNEEAIESAKKAYRAIGLDGYPIKG